MNLKKITEGQKESLWNTVLKAKDGTKPTSLKDPFLCDWRQEQPTDRNDSATEPLSSEIFG